MTLTPEITLTPTTDYNFEFTHSPLINKIHLVQIDQNPWLKQAMDRDFTDTFFEDLDFRVQNERNSDIIIHGETGSGKSALAQNIYYEHYIRAKKWINPKVEFNADHICFTRTEWLSETEKLLRGDTLIFDEDDQSRIGVGSFRQLEEQEKIEKTLRQSQFNFLFCSPILEQHVEHYILHAFDIEFNKSINRAVLYKKDNIGMVVPYGFIMLKRHVVEGYEAKKKKFRTSVQDRTVSDRFKEYDEVARQLIETQGIDKIKTGRIRKSLVQRKFPRFVDEEVKEILTSVDLISENIDTNDLFSGRRKSGRQSKL